MPLTTCDDMNAPDDASSLAESCRVRFDKEDQCPIRATYRLLIACTGCHASNVYPMCGAHLEKAVVKLPTRVTVCCRRYIAIVALEAL